MTPAIPTIRLPALLTGLAVALCAGFALPETAAASCGDWLVPMDAEHETVVPPQLLQELRPSSELPLPSPCRGPGCGNAPESPFPPATTTGPSTDGERWGCLLAEASPRSNRHGHGMPVDDLSPPAGFRPLLERPPRLPG